LAAGSFGLAAVVAGASVVVVVVAVAVVVAPVMVGVVGGGVGTGLRRGSGSAAGTSGAAVAFAGDGAWYMSQSGSAERFSRRVKQVVPTRNGASNGSGHASATRVPWR
jgi:hypothetical protein